MVHSMGVISRNLVCIKKYCSDCVSNSVKSIPLYHKIVSVESLLDTPSKLKWIAQTKLFTQYLKILVWRWCVWNFVHIRQKKKKKFDSRPNCGLACYSSTVWPVWILFLSWVKGKYRNLATRYSSSIVQFFSVQTHLWQKHSAKKNIIKINNQNKHNRVPAPFLLGPFIINLQYMHGYEILS